MFFHQLLIICALTLNGCCSLWLSDMATTPKDDEWLSTHKIPLFIWNKKFSKIKIEIDRVDGLRPHWNSVAHLKKILKEYLSHINQIEIQLDKTISLAQFKKHFTQGVYQPKSFAKEFQSLKTKKNEYLIYLIVVPEFSDDHAGLFVQLDERRAMITLSRNNIELYAYFYITNKSAEARVLQHELGHALGLCHNPEHSQLIDGGHCTRPWCNMYKRDFNWRFVLCNLWPAIIGTVEKDYCECCKNDLLQYKNLE